MDTNYVLQALNGVLTPVTLWAMFIFTRYLWLNRALGYFELRAAIALCTLSLGEFIFRGSIFLARTLESLDIDAPYMNIFYVAGAICVLVAFLCKIRVFSPQRWGHKSWVLPLIMSIIITTTSLVYVLRR